MTQGGEVVDVATARGTGPDPPAALSRQSPRSLAGRALQQRRQPVVDEPPHGQGGVDPLDPGDGQHLLGDPPEVVGVLRRHLDEQVGDARTGR